MPIEPAKAFRYDSKMSFSKLSESYAPECSCFRIKAEEFLNTFSLSSSTSFLDSVSNSVRSIKSFSKPRPTATPTVIPSSTCFDRFSRVPRISPTLSEKSSVNSKANFRNFGAVVSINFGCIYPLLVLKQSRSFVSTMLSPSLVSKIFPCIF